MKCDANVAKSRQDGIVLLIFAVILAFAAITFVVKSVSIEQLRSQQTEETHKSLSRAKQALLDFAVTHIDGNAGEYGFLPCPDYTSGGFAEGGSDSPCGSTNENKLGLFPWASLETGILKSGTGECLWYAVSGEYTKPPQTAMLNEDTNGALRLYQYVGGASVIKQGALAEDRVVAMIFDPSEVLLLRGQNRTFNSASLCGLDYLPMEYLEGDGVIENALLAGGTLSIDEFVAGGFATDELPTPFNDRIVTITREELWNAVRLRQDFIANADSTMRRHAEALAWCIAEYGNNSGNRKLPRPVAIDFSGADYRIDTNYSDTAGVSYLGRYPYIVDDSDAALGAIYAPNIGEPTLFNKGFCTALAVAGGPVIDLETVTAEGYKIWKNWKDHFFYAVSSYYAPVNAPDAGAPSCDGSNCIVVGGAEYAAIVLYAGSRTGAQLRNEPIAGDADTKNSLLNYIEVINPAGDGTGDYTLTGNDIAYCITDSNPLTVVSCL